jgi:hypothetical protein
MRWGWPVLTAARNRRKHEVPGEVTPAPAGEWRRLPPLGLAVSPRPVLVGASLLRRPDITGTRSLLDRRPGPTPRLTGRVSGLVQAPARLTAKDFTERQAGSEHRGPQERTGSDQPSPGEYLLPSERPRLAVVAAPGQRQILVRATEEFTGEPQPDQTPYASSAWLRMVQAYRMLPGESGFSQTANPDGSSVMSWSSSAAIPPPRKAASPASPARTPRAPAAGQRRASLAESRRLGIGRPVTRPDPDPAPAPPQPQPQPQPQPPQLRNVGTLTPAMPQPQPPQLRNVGTLTPSMPQRGDAGAGAAAGRGAAMAQRGDAGVGAAAGRGAAMAQRGDAGAGAAAGRGAATPQGGDGWAAGPGSGRDHLAVDRAGAPALGLGAPVTGRGGTAPRERPAADQLTHRTGAAGVTGHTSSVPGADAARPGASSAPVLPAVRSPGGAGQGDPRPGRAAPTDAAPETGGHLDPSQIATQESVATGIAGQAAPGLPGKVIGSPGAAPGQEPPASSAVPVRNVVAAPYRVAPTYRVAPAPARVEARPLAGTGEPREPLIHRPMPAQTVQPEPSGVPASVAVPAAPAAEQAAPPGQRPPQAPPAETGPGGPAHQAGFDGQAERGFAPHDLADALRRRLGVDVSDVVVNREAAAAEHARLIGARAFTSDGEVTLPAQAGPMQRPQTRALLAHELTHAAQQRALGPGLPPAGSEEAARLEAEAGLAERGMLGWAAAGQRPAEPALAAPAGARPTAGAMAPPLRHPLPFASGAFPAAQRQTEEVPSASSGGNAFDPFALLPQQASRESGDQAQADVRPGPASASPGPAADTRLWRAQARLLELAAQRLLDLDDSVAIGELADGIYPRLRARLKRELLVDRERSGLLSDYR